MSRNSRKSRTGSKAPQAGDAGGGKSEYDRSECRNSNLFSNVDGIEELGEVTSERGEKTFFKNSDFRGCASRKNSFEGLGILELGKASAHSCSEIRRSGRSRVSIVERDPDFEYSLNPSCQQAPRRQKICGSLSQSSSIKSRGRGKARSISSSRVEETDAPPADAQSGTPAGSSEFVDDFIGNTDEESWWNAPRQKLREKVLSSSADPEVVLNSLLSNSSTPLESQSLTSVASLCFTAPRSAAAKKDPIFAFKKVFKAMTQVEPLDVSLISATTAEIFLPPQLLDQVTTRLSNTNHLIPLPVLSEKDLRRRAASYNRGYFRPLRRASLSGFPTALQLRMLEIAEQSIPNLPEGRQQDVRHAIMMDREWVTGEEM